MSCSTWTVAQRELFSGTVVVAVLKQKKNCFYLFITILKGDFLGFFFLFMYDIQHCFICRPTDSTVSEDAGVEPGTVATTALAVRRSNHSARSHPHSARSHPLSARFHPHSARSHPLSARFHPHSARSHPLSTTFHPHSARSHPHLIYYYSIYKFIPLVLVACF